MCLGLAFFEQILIWLVVIGAVWAVVKLLLPVVLGFFGTPGTLIIQVINIILVAAILIFVIVVAFDLLSCLAGMRIAR